MDFTGLTKMIRKTLRNLPCGEKEQKGKTYTAQQYISAAQDNNLNYVVLWNLEEIERYKNELIERFVLK